MEAWGCGRRSSGDYAGADVAPRYLADTSAWTRSGQIADRWAELLDFDEIALCLPVRLELLYSSRGSRDYAALAEDLRGLTNLPIDPGVECAAVQSQAALARDGHHRGPTPADLLIAAVAEAHSVTLLHYDRQFDLIADATGQPAEWVAARGMLK